MSVYRAHAARVLYAIEKKYADPSFTVETAARLIGISSQHICRVLKRERGLTFADLLRDVRVREARRLLQESSLSMKEIAFHVGFRHPSHFTRVFTDRCGMPPSEFRARAIVADVHQQQAM